MPESDSAPLCGLLDKSKYLLPPPMTLAPLLPAHVAQLCLTYINLSPHPVQSPSALSVFLSILSSPLYSPTETYCILPCGCEIVTQMSHFLHASINSSLSRNNFHNCPTLVLTHRDILHP